jgi:hypothetical protein
MYDIPWVPSSQSVAWKASLWKEVVEVAEKFEDGIHSDLLCFELQ